MELLEKVLFLFLGWLLGMLSPVIVDAIRKHREVREVKKALLAELSDLQFRLSGTVYLTTIKTGQYDRAFLEWYNPIIQRNRYLHNLDSVLKSTQSGLAMSDDTLAIVATELAASQNKAMGLKKHHAPLLNSKIGQFGSFSVNFQRLLLEIHSRLAILNEEIDQYRFYFQLTFSNNALDTDNYKLVIQNIDGSYVAVRDQARMICDFIGRAMELGE